MKLFDFAMAPNPRRVRIYLAEKGIEIPTVQVDILRGENAAPEFLAKNPLGSVPVLELDDGTCLTESLAIIQYFEDLHPEPVMIGREPLERARVRELERLCEMSILLRAGRIFFHTSPVFRSAGQVPEIAEFARRGLANALAVVDRRIGASPFAAGDAVTIADCTLFAGVEHLRRAGIEVPDDLAHLRRWHRDFSRRPSASV